MHVAIRTLWFRALYASMAHFAFRHIRVVGRRLPSNEPVLYVCLHRNGALDGAVYGQAVPHAQRTLSSQLRRGLLARMLFDGIEIVRAKDTAQNGGRLSNRDAFAKCVAHLADGGAILFFPEGTSELGPHHLKFRNGVARLIQSTLARIPTLKVVALAAHYEAPTEWQSDVEVVAGAGEDFSGDLATGHIMARITAMLESVGVDCATIEERTELEALAYAATLGQPDIGNAQALQLVRGSERGRMLPLWAHARQEGLWLHQGIPLVPTRAPWLYALLWVLLTPFVVAAAALNLPVVVLAWYAPRKLADGPNVISLWRALAGIVSAYAWVPLATGVLLGMFGVVAALAYLAVSVAGLKSLYRWRKLSIALHNQTRASAQTRRSLHRFHAGIVHFVRSRLAKDRSAV
jgi:1-acyl-sn-glycerol-3-phosphate acyltransferase